ncbi:MAG TPA: valine--tRNA ligase [Opitutaceae bacterium]|nr:valine--tRNA ligase [Opitutaceae bacterium]
MTEIPKSYEPRDVEKKWYAAWQAAGCFRGQPVAGRENYTIVIPPPNVTGILHMGHVLNNSLQDAIVRRARLEGKTACWIPGTDHAGIATQTMVEKHLRKTEKKTRRDLGREEFLKRVWEWREKSGNTILKQLRELGSSCDWERTTFTMDPAYSRSVLTAFVKLFESGRIYRGKRMVNWCPVSLTALSDEEVIMKPQKGFIYKLRYELVDQPGQFLTVETTRPETIPADVALAVHPDDERYKHLIGKTVWRPLGKREPLPIVADTAVDPAFAAGVLKVTPAHDKTDFEIGQRHKLPVIDVLNPDGVLNELAGPELAGMERFAGRKKASQLLLDAGLLVEEKAYENNVGFSERADVPIEPRLTQQWWLRYPRVEEAKQVVRDGLIKFYPERWTKVYLNWLDGIQDWCISRQLWWGHRIPVWYRKGIDKEKLTEADLKDPTKVHVSLDGPADPQNWDQEEDVLDTWASSWLWPIGTLGWPNAEAQQKLGFDALYPTTTLATGADIIFFWVARMIMAGLEFARPGAPVEQRIPFRHVYFNGIVRDKQGRKMSKTLGNSPDPLELIAKYGADGLRFGLLQIAPLGQDVKFDEERVEGGRNFCNKLWNASRFRQMSGEMSDNSSLDAITARLQPALFDEDDHAILAALTDTMRVLEESFAGFEFAAATQKLYSFFWGDFCDWYVEVSKAKLQDAQRKANCLAIQDLVIREFLLLFEPFAPHITEELWHLLGYGAEGTYLQQTRLDTAAGLAAALVAKGVTIDAAATAAVEQLKKVVQLARTLKADKAAAQRRDVKLVFVTTDASWSVLERAAAKIIRMVGAAELTRTTTEPALSATVTPLGTLYLDLGASVDAGAEKAKMAKELEKLNQLIAGTEARLANTAFTSKAPAAVLEGAKKQLADLQAKRAEVERLLKALG